MDGIVRTIWLQSKGGCMLNRCAWVLAALMALDASAQEAGQIVGVVRDASGAAVPAASITATETGTGFSSTVKTGSEGQFVLPSLRPTVYVISAEAAGFRRYSQS